MTSEIDTATVPVGDLSAYLARPAAGSDGAGMLLLPMITGINYRVREFAAEIAAQGITTLTWDPWHGPSSDDVSHEELVAMMDKLDDETVLAEHAQLLDYLFGELGVTKAGVIGWCLGGRLALLLAGRDRRLANVVAFHPTVMHPPRENHTLDAVEYTRRITSPVMMLYPTADAIVPWSSYAALRDALESREAGASIIHVYPSAEHGFSNDTSHGNAVNADAYAVSWPQALEFMKTTTR